MVARKLLIVTALVETATGLILLVSPTLLVAFLLGASLDAPAALVVARMAGAAVLSLGCACWLARNDAQRGAATALVGGMLLYNMGAVVVLGDAGIRSLPVGVEIGQLMFVGAVLTVFAVGCRAARRLQWSQAAWLWRIAPYAIGALASFWLVERVTAF